jgi:cytochrome c-type biogenesis protein CcmH/NrfG
MANEVTAARTASETLRSVYVYGMALTCLVAGLAIGYLLRGSQSPASPEQAAANSAATSSGSVARVGQIPDAKKVNQMTDTQAPGSLNGATASPHAGHMPTLEEMKEMADKQAAPLKEKLKSDPNNSAELMHVAAIYHTAHQFKEAADYYAKAVQEDPKNVAARTKLATSLFRSGDADGAIAQLNRALSYDPKDANALFDLGMIRLQGKQDGRGALAAWQQLLKTNPQMSSERRAQVQKLMADVMTTLSDQHAMEGARSNDGHKSNSN